MKRKHQILYTWLFGAVLAVAGLLVASCTDNENAAAPVITGVRVTDPGKKDSTFVKAGPGTMIVIEGKNFVDVKTIELNGMRLMYNPNYLLSTSLIATIPAEVPVRSKKSDIPNSIRIVTVSGETSYSFIFLSPLPEIGLLKFQPPATAGRPMEIIGANFEFVRAVLFVADGAVQATVTDFFVNEGHDVITFTIPEGGVTDGEVVLIAEGDTPMSAEYVTNPYPQFAALSDDIQIPGDTLSITGRYFTFINKVILPGDVEIELEDLVFNKTYSRIDLVVPEGLTDAGKVRIVTEFGDVIESPTVFNDKSGIMRDWDGIGFDWGKGTTELANSTRPPFHGMGSFVHYKKVVDANTTGWVDEALLVASRNLYPTPTGVTDATPIGELALAMNFYTINPFNKGYWKSVWGNGTTNEAKFRPYNVRPARWTTIRLPLTDMLPTGYNTWGDVKTIKPPGNDSNVLEWLFFQYLNDASEPVDLNVFIDNVRIVKIP